MNPQSRVCYHKKAQAVNDEHGAWLKDRFKDDPEVLSHVVEVTGALDGAVLFIQARMVEIMYLSAIRPPGFNPAKEYEDPYAGLIVK